MKLTLALSDAKINRPYFLGCSEAFTLSLIAVESHSSITILVSP